MTGFYFAVAIAILVAIHEWGHFAVAKLCGIGVEVFSIGFGPRVIGFKRGETEYRLSLIPLGGYVKITGQDPEDTEAMTAHPDRAFALKPRWQQVAVVLAGPAMNLLLALVLLPLVFLVGHPEPKKMGEPPVVERVVIDSPAAEAGLKAGDRILSVDGRETATWLSLLEELALLGNREVAPLSFERDGAVRRVEIHAPRDAGAPRSGVVLGIEGALQGETLTLVGGVLPGSPAKKAGIKAGDRILEIDGEMVSEWSQIVDRVQNSEGRSLAMTLARGGETLVISLSPERRDDKGWVIGLGPQVAAGEMIVRQYGLRESLHHGWKEMKRMTGMTVSVLKRLLSAQLSVKALSGPLGIAEASGAAAKAGLGSFLYFLAFLSINLGVLNLLPFPVLDGGHVAFMAVEFVIRRPLPPRVKAIIQTGAIFLLIALMLVVTVQDMDNLWGFQNLFQTVKGWIH